MLFSVSCSAFYKGAGQVDASQVFTNPRMIEAARAVERDDTAALDALVRAGLDVNERGKQGVTLLMWAMKWNKKNSMRDLLRHRANPNVKLENNDSAVTIAAGSPDSEILRILLEAGGDPNSRNRLGDPAIDEAADRSLWRNWDLLVSHGADPSALDRAGSTVLVRLAQVNQFIDVERLLDRGIDVKKPNHQSHTLLWYVEHSPVSSDLPQGKARERIRSVLKQRGVQ